MKSRGKDWETFEKKKKKKIKEEKKLKKKKKKQSISCSIYTLCWWKKWRANRRKKQLYIWKYSSKRKNQVSDSEKWYYLAVTRLSALLRGAVSKNNGEFTVWLA